MNSTAYCTVHFSAQAGQNDMATELLHKAIKIEQEELGERPERMLELLYLEAYIMDEVKSLTNFLSTASHIFLNMTQHSFTHILNIE